MARSAEPNLRHRGLFRLRGPSPGFVAWVQYLLDVRREWHEGDPPSSHRRSHVLVMGGTAAVLVALAERLLG